MTTNKDKGGPAAANKAIVKANNSALKGFPKAKLRTAFDNMATLAKTGDDANESRQAAALGVIILADTFAGKNSEADNDTIVTGWRDHLKLLVMELAVAGNRFAELTEGKGDNAATAKLTGYGNNVASIAKGVLEFRGDDTPIVIGDSYREVRTAVEAKRAEARRAADPDGAILADAKQAADDAWGELRKVIFETGDAGNIDQLREVLEGQLSDVQAQLIAQADTEAEAHNKIVEETEKLQADIDAAAKEDDAKVEPEQTDAEIEAELAAIDAAELAADQAIAA